jgi:hypothetical protein
MQKGSRGQARREREKWPFLPGLAGVVLHARTDEEK